MKFVLEKNRFLSAIAFLYWFIDNAKYGVSLLLFKQHPSYQYYLTAGSTIFLLLATVFFEAKLYTERKLTKNAFNTPMEVVLLATLMAFAGFSFLWSNGGMFALGIWGGIVLNCGIFFLLCRYGDIRLIVSSSMKGFIFGLLFTTMILLALHPLDTPTIGRLGMDNVLEAVVMGRKLSYANIFLLFMIFSTSNRKQKIWLTGIFILFVYTFMLTFAKVASVSFFIVVLVMLFMQKIPIQQKTLVLASVLGLGTIGAFMSYDRFIGYTHLAGGHALESFSGRAPLWIVACSMIQRNPLIGYGAGATLDISQILAINPDFTVVRTHVLNEWLNMWFQYGLFGLCLTLAIYYGFLRKCFRAYEKGAVEVASLGVGVILFTLLNTPFEATIVGFLLPEPFIVLFAFWLKSAIVEAAYQEENNVAPRVSSSFSMAAMAKMH